MPQRATRSLENVLARMAVVAAPNGKDVITNLFPTSSAKHRERGHPVTSTDTMLSLEQAMFLTLTMMYQTKLAQRNTRMIKAEDLMGLWQAIDPSDGSVQTMSITCPEDKNEPCEVLLTDTYFALCGGEGRGITFISWDREISKESKVVLKNVELVCEGGLKFTFTTEVTIHPDQISRPDLPGPGALNYYKVNVGSGGFA